MDKKTNLVVDIGNTKIKSAIFVDDRLKSRYTASTLEEIYGHYKGQDHSWIFSSVRKSEEEIRNVCTQVDLMVLNKDTSLPIGVHYKTPETMGLDRIAAAVGANYLYPHENVLVIDMGTCITYDIVNRQGTFQGGIIAPGLKMRMRAMNYFTERLPDISSDWQNIPLNFGSVGKSTLEGLVKGSYEALLHEINGFIDGFQKEYSKLTVMMTGGDAVHFESNLKAHIFANFDLVLIGLNRILKHNQ